MRTLGWCDRHVVDAYDRLGSALLDSPAIPFQLGLVPGDLIQQLNGQRLTSPEQALQVFKKAWQQATLEVSGLRGAEQFVSTIEQETYRLP